MSAFDKLRWNTDLDAHIHKLQAPRKPLVAPKDNGKLEWRTGQGTIKPKERKKRDLTPEEVERNEKDTRIRAKRQQTAALRRQEKANVDREAKLAERIQREVELLDRHEAAFPDTEPTEKWSVRARCTREEARQQVHRLRKCIASDGPFEGRMISKTYGWARQYLRGLNITLRWCEDSKKHIAPGFSELLALSTIRAAPPVTANWPQGTEQPLWYLDGFPEACNDLICGEVKRLRDTRGGVELPPPPVSGDPDPTDPTDPTDTTDPGRPGRPGRPGAYVHRALIGRSRGSESEVRAFLCEFDLPVLALDAMDDLEEALLGPRVGVSGVQRVRRAFHLPNMLDPGRVRSEWRRLHGDTKLFQDRLRESLQKPVGGTSGGNQ